MIVAVVVAEEAVVGQLAIAKNPVEEELHLLLLLLHFHLL